MSTPKLSVIVPVYNSEKYIERCLNSIINQSYKNIEIIVVDDCSTDKTSSIIQNLFIYDNRLVYIKLEKNVGVGNARNIGVENATGKYIGFVDSDDWVDSNMYYYLINACESNNTQIAMCGILDEYDNNISSVFRYKYPIENIINNDFALNILSRCESQDIFITPIVNNKIYSLKFLKENNIFFPVGMQFEDNVFTFLLFTRKCNLSIVKNTVYHYYQRQDSLFHSLSKTFIDDFFASFGYLKNELNSQKTYILFQDKYMSFFDRTLSVIINMVFSVENNMEIQKRYFAYINEKLFNNKELFKEYINYLDVMRIKNFFSSTK